MLLSNDVLFVWLWAMILVVLETIVGADAIVVRIIPACVDDVTPGDAGGVVLLACWS